MRININCDIGEGHGRWRMGDDQALMELIGSANIACGMHAGDATIMADTIGLAIANGVSIGAHPGFNDIWGFGRRQIVMRPRDLELMVTYQIGALQALARSQGAQVTHVKPHGALNNMAHDNRDYALAIGRGIKAADPALIYVANVGSEMEKAGLALGLRVARESYVDRLYDDNGKMASRERPDAVIRDPAQAVAQVLRFLEEKALVTASGKRIPAEIDTFCIHGDEPTAVPIARALIPALKEAGIEMVPLPALIG
jgi:UPF0271 protein